MRTCSVAASPARPVSAARRAPEPHRSAPKGYDRSPHGTAGFAPAAPSSRCLDESTDCAVLLRKLPRRVPPGGHVDEQLRGDVADDASASPCCAGVPAAGTSAFALGPRTPPRPSQGARRPRSLRFRPRWGPGHTPSNNGDGDSTTRIQKGSPSHDGLPFALCPWRGGEERHRGLPAYIGRTQLTPPRLLAREGYALIAGAAVLGLVLAALGLALGGWGLLLVALGALLLGFTVWFFRDPRRTPPVGADLLLAPADGKVVELVVEHEPLYLEAEAQRVSIFLSPLNVHVNRVPASGVVEYARYVPGDYLVAWHPKASALNERSEIGVRHPSGTPVLFKQIAGAVARRIVYYLKVGDRVEAGQRFGIVKFGSR